MRRIVRPFVKEFKSRSAKAAAGRLPSLDEAVAEPKPAFLDIAAFAPWIVERETPHDDSYEAAMKAADRVFGKKAEPATTEAAATPATTGRVLPSLIETIAPAPEQPEPVRRGPGRPRIKKIAEPEAELEAPIRRAPRRSAPTQPAPAPRRSPAPQPPIAVTAPQPPAPIAVAVAAEGERTSRRIRRSIQLRWVLGTELRAGERWKRRLPEAAR